MFTLIHDILNLTIYKHIKSELNKLNDETNGLL